MDKQEQILTSATQIFLKDGFGKASMRKIAKGAGCSVGTLYLYYKNKDELFYDVQKIAFNHFLNYMKPLMDIEHPVERLKKIGETYLFFALQNPDYYDLMFIIEAPMNAVEENEGWQKGTQLFNTLKFTLVECIEKGFTHHKDINALSYLFWSMVHGMVSLAIRDRVKVMRHNDMQALMRKGNQMLISAFFK